MRWSSLVARQPHKLKVVRSNRTRATILESVVNTVSAIIDRQQGDSFIPRRLMVGRLNLDQEIVVRAHAGEPLLQQLSRLW